MRTSGALRKLMAAGRDGARLLRSESAFVDDARRAVLVRLADQRQTSVERLEVVNGQPGGEGASGSWPELWRELGRTIRVAAGGPNNGDAVAACRRAMGRVEAAYDRAVRLPWPKETLDLLLEQRRGLGHASEELASIQF